MKSMLPLLHSSLHGKVEGGQRSCLLVLAAEKWEESLKPAGGSAVGVVWTASSEILGVLRLDERQDQIERAAAGYLLLELRSQETDGQQGVVRHHFVLGEGQRKQPVVRVLTYHAGASFRVSVHGTVGQGSGTVLKHGTVWTSTGNEDTVQSSYVD